MTVAHPYRAAVEALSSPRQISRGAIERLEEAAVQIESALLRGELDGLSREEAAELALAVAEAHYATLRWVVVFRAKTVAGAAMLTALAAVCVRVLPGMWAVVVPVTIAAVVAGIGFGVADLESRLVRLGRIKDICGNLQKHALSRPAPVRVVLGAVTEEEVVSSEAEAPRKGQR